MAWAREFAQSLLGSPALASRVNGAFVDTEERAGKGASDHAPVVVELAD